jgi:hypothetical protein
MRVHGYCTECKKPKMVKVASNALALVAAMRGVVRGICSGCDEAAKQKRQSGARARR